jgi:hypothetical protein
MISEVKTRCDNFAPGTVGSDDVLLLGTAEVLTHQ